MHVCIDLVYPLRAGKGRGQVKSVWSSDQVEALRNLGMRWIGRSRSVWHYTNTAWDLSSLIASWIGSDALIDHDSNSVLYPLVKQYGSARAARLLFSAVGASCFTMAALSDMMGSSLAMRWGLPAIKFLRWSRRLGFLGSLEHAVATFQANFLRI